MKLSDGAGPDVRIQTDQIVDRFIDYVMPEGDGQEGQEAWAHTYFLIESPSATVRLPVGYNSV